MSLFRKKYTTLGPNGERVVKRSKKWYGRYTDENGRERRVPLSPNKTVAQQMLAKLLEKVDRKRAKLHTPAEDQAGRTLAEHLADYEAALLAKGRGVEDVRQTLTRIRAVVTGCGFVFPADVEVTAVRELLARLQHDGARPALPAQEWFTPAELAALLKIRRQSVTAILRRHGLHKTGQGRARARKFPRATAEHLLDLSCRGLGSQTASHYWREFKAFCRWLAHPKRQGMTLNPLEGEQGPAPRSDPRHDRRPLPPDDLRRLLDVTRASGRTWRGLTGLDRWHLYLTACVTGYRRKELASLTPRSFDLDVAPAVVSLPGRRTKNKKGAEQPLPADVAETLRGYLAGRPADLPLWPLPDIRQITIALRHDLEAAGIPYVVEGLEGPLYFDLHAMRHSYVAMLDQSGATLKEAMQLARHADPRLTIARYGRLEVHDLGAAVERLPSLLPADTGKDKPTEAAALQATGTEGAGADGPEWTKKWTKTAESEREPLTSSDDNAPAKVLSATPSRATSLKVFEAQREGTTSDDNNSAMRKRPVTATGRFSWGRVGA